MIIGCNHKGCYAQTNAVLNKESDEVICLDCGNPISNVTQYTKKTLLSLGQVSRTNNKKPFQAYCQQCHEQKGVILTDAGPECSGCHGALKLSKYFLNAMKNFSGTDAD